MTARQPQGTPMTTLERPEIRHTGLLGQSLAIARRNFIHIKRMPEMLMDVTIQPVMFVLLFAFVFGGVDRRAAIAGRLPRVPAARDHGADRRLRLVHRRRRPHRRPRQGHRRPDAVAADQPGGGAGRAQPLQPGCTPRIGLVVMSLTGLAIGWRIHTNFLEAAARLRLLLGWGFAMIWVGILVGSAMRSVEAVNGVMFATMFPITFLANTFAPTDAMPTVLRFIAEWNPLSVADPGGARALGQRPAARRGRGVPAAPPGPVHDRLDHPDHRGRGAAGHPHVPRRTATERGWRGAWAG